jgi:hypothetical protein
MLTFKDLKQLRCKSGYPKDGTKLIITTHIGHGMTNDVEIEFHGFNSFRSKTGEQKMSWEVGFGSCGGAHSWDDFSTRGRRWIQENYDPDRCTLIVDVPTIGIEGVRASQVRLLQ